MAITFDVTKFRTQFSAFSDETAYPDDTLQMFFDTATCYVEAGQGGRLSDACRLQALNFMTAHLVRMSDLIAAGSAPSFVTSSSIGGVSVTAQPPPETDQYDWWLSLTSYGQQVNALLAAASIGGLYIGGRGERSAFRKVGGVF